MLRPFPRPRWQYEFAPFRSIDQTKNSMLRGSIWGFGPDAFRTIGLLLLFPVAACLSSCLFPCGASGSCPSHRTQIHVSFTDSPKQPWWYVLLPILPGNNGVVKESADDYEAWIRVRPGQDVDTAIQDSATGLKVSVYTESKIDPVTKIRSPYFGFPPRLEPNIPSEILVIEAGSPGGSIDETNRFVKALRNHLYSR
jgi:hypothetical protein